METNLGLGKNIPQLQYRWLIYHHVPVNFQEIR